MTPATQPATDPAAEALRGPWQAVITDPEGCSVTIDEAVTERLDEVGMAIVRGTAAPAALGRAIPDGFSNDDVIWPGIQADETHSDEEWLRMCWARVQAMVAGLNAAAEAGARTTTSTEQRAEQKGARDA